MRQLERDTSSELVALPWDDMSSENLRETVIGEWVGGEEETQCLLVFVNQIFMRDIHLSVSVLCTGNGC